MTPRSTQTKSGKGFPQVLKQFGVDDPRGIEVYSLLAGSARLFEVIADHNLQAAGLSVSRMRLLLWLYIDELRGNTQGLSPSRLSHFQHVSKNTVSSLLASLEEQGLIERTLSQEDKRKFNIRLNQTGRELMCATLPKHGKFLNEMLKALTAPEQKTLIELLFKLRQAFIEQVPQGALGYRKPEEGE